MIEEAAGITKFKARKKTAERKMDQTRTNLTRVDDILRELTRNLDSLKRQAAKAERYKKLCAEQKELDLYIQSFKYLEHFMELRALGSSSTAAEAEVEGARLALRMREAEAETEQLALDEAQREAQLAEQASYGLDNETRLLEGELKQASATLAGLGEREASVARELNEIEAGRERLLSERDVLERNLEGADEAAEEMSERVERENEAWLQRRSAVENAREAVDAAKSASASAQQRIARAEAAMLGFVRRREETAARRDKLIFEREELEARVVEIEHERADLSARLEGLRGGRETDEARREELAQRLEAARARYTEVTAIVDELREDVTKKRSRLQSLREVHQRFEGVGAGVRALMTRQEQAGQTGVRGLVADRIECDEDYTNALAAALGDALQHLVVDSPEAALEAIAYLRGDPVPGQR